MNPLDALVQFWNYLISLPAPVATGLLIVAKILAGIGAVIVIFRKAPVIDARTVALPFAFWVIADFSSFLYGAYAWSVLLIIYTISSVIAVITAAILLLRAFKS